MNYIAHSKAAEFLGMLGVLGSQLPDMQGLRVLHRRGNDFFGYVSGNYPDYSHLSLGVLSHNVLDRLSNNSPLLSEAKQDAKRMVKAADTGIGMYGLMVAHEMIVDISVDSLLLEREPGLAQMAADCWKDLPVVQQCIAGFTKEGVSLEEFSGHALEIMASYFTVQGCALSFSMRLSRLMAQNGKPSPNDYHGLEGVFHHTREALIRAGCIEEMDCLFERTRQAVEQLME